MFWKIIDDKFQSQKPPKNYALNIFEFIVHSWINSKGIRGCDKEDISRKMSISLSVPNQLLCFHYFEKFTVHTWVILQAA